MADRFGPEHVITIQQALAYLHTEVERLNTENRGIYTATSQAAKEHASYAKPDSIFNAIGLSYHLIESGGDHLSVLSKILTNPIEIIASWTCIRSMLESCALAAWLLDPDIDAQARARRAFALRYEGMDQLLKFGRAANAPATEIAGQEAKIDALEQDAKTLGFPRVENKKGERIGVGEQMPSATDLIRDVLGEEKMYRMLSAVAHGHHWAVRELCYVASPDDDEQIGGTKVKAFKKNISVDKIALLTVCGVRAFTRALWNQCRYFGWNEIQFEEVFEKVADRLQMAELRRFWRSYPAAKATK